MVKMIIAFDRRPGMTQKEFRDYRLNVHAPLLLSLPEARFIRRLVVSYPVPAPNFPAAGHDAVVETWFDSMDDLEGLVLSENFKTKIDPDHANFVDLDSVVLLVTDELVVVG